jgi:hypothetical protein
MLIERFATVLTGILLVILVLPIQPWRKPS